MGSNYKVAYDAEWSKLKKLDPLDVSRRLEVEYYNNKKQFIVPFFEKDYILDFETETIYRKEDGREPMISNSIIILNYLTHSTENIINTNKWITLKEIPNGGALFYPAFHKSTIVPLIESFGDNLQSFEVSASKLGGKIIKFGDIAYTFNILPKVNICIAIWEGDDELSPNATVLFESSIQHLVHIETVIGIGMCVAEKTIYKKH